MQDHVRTDGMEEISVSLRVLDGEATGAGLIGQAGSPLQLDVAEVAARHHTTDEFCKVSIDVLPLPLGDAEAPTTPNDAQG